MKNIILIIQMLFVLNGMAFAQSPSPIYEYRFSTSNHLTATIGGNAESSNNLLRVPDRFNIQQEAVLFSNSNSHLVLPGVLSQSLPNLNDVHAITTDGGYTVSFWVKFPSNMVSDLSAPTGTPRPYTSADNLHQIFYGKNSDGKLPIGVGRIRDRVILNRMTTSNPPKEWNLWLWDPVAFHTADEWFQVFYVIRFNKTRVYMYNMSGDEFCRLNYFHAPDISNVVEWGFGSLGGSPTSFHLDDIKIYGTALSQGDIAEINSEDIGTSGSSARMAAEEEIVVLEDDETMALEEDSWPISIHPNPSSGTFNVSLPQEKEGSMTVQVISLQGSLIYNLDVETTTGNNKLSINLPSKARSGMYIIKVLGVDFSYERNIIVIK